jgi:hypothetical protein
MRAEGITNKPLKRLSSRLRIYHQKQGYVCLYDQGFAGVANIFATLAAVPCRQPINPVIKYDNA